MKVQLVDEKPLALIFCKDLEVKCVLKLIRDGIVAYQSVVLQNVFYR